jgi:hypothetical protein
LPGVGAGLNLQAVPQPPAVESIPLLKDN